MAFIIRYQGDIDWFSFLSALMWCFAHFKHLKEREERTLSPEEKSASTHICMNRFSYLFLQKELASKKAAGSTLGITSAVLCLLIHGR